MALPAAVQRQLDEAEQIEKAIAEELNPTQPQAKDVPPQQPEVPPEKAQPAETAAAVSDEPWERPHKVLQAKYDAEVPRLHGSVREMQDQLNRALGEIEGLKRKPTEPEKAAVQESLVTEKDVEAYGADLVDLASRIARQEIGKKQAEWNAEIGKRDQYIASLEKDVGQVAQRMGARDTQDFFGQMNARIPDWEGLQNSAEGQEFLVSRVPGTSTTWDAALKQSAAELDVSRAVEIFDELARRSPHLRPQQDSTTKRTANELERQVAPTRSRAAAPTDGTDGKPRYTWANWSAAQDTINKRQVVGVEAEKLQAELDAAYAEGRIT